MTKDFVVRVVDVKRVIKDILKPLRDPVKLHMVKWSWDIAYIEHVEA